MRLLVVGEERASELAWDSAFTGVGIGRPRVHGFNSLLVKLKLKSGN